MNPQELEAYEIEQKIKKIKINTVNQIWDIYKEQESQYFEQYRLGLITSLELANQIIRLNKAQAQTIKNLFK
jgi:hypothetical protein